MCAQQLNFIDYLLQISGHGIRISQALMLINVLCSSAHPKHHTHSPGAYSEIIWSKTAILLMNPELYLSCLRNYQAIIQLKV